MALLGIGVFSGVVISKVTYNKSDQGLSLDITFKKTGEKVEEGEDELAFLSAGSVGSSDEGKENNIRLYGLNLTNYEGNTKSGDDLLNELLAKQAQLVHIASAYLPADKIKAAWALTKGIEVKTKDELVKAITKQNNLDKVVENLFTQFVALMTPVVGEESKHVVVKFLRKSKASNFPRLADKKLDWNPFIADEQDTKLVAKIKFSKWEQEQGLDSNAQSLDDADSTNADTLATQTAAVNSVFG